MRGRIIAIRCSPLAALLAAVATLAGAAGGTSAPASQVPNPTFGTNGTITSEVTTGGITYVGGTFTGVGRTTGPGVNIDASTGSGMSFPGVSGATTPGGLPEVFTVVADNSGGFYVGGDFTHVGGIARRDLAHILGNGTVDPNFDPEPDGFGIHALAVSGSTVYVGGSFDTIGGQPRSDLAALNASTGLATSWNPDANGTVTALAATSSAVYAGGNFTDAGSATLNGGFAALDTTDGKELTAWASSPQPLGTDNVNVITVAPSGSPVYVGGAFNFIGSSGRAHIAAYNATNGSLNAFDPSANAAVNAIAVSSNGSNIYVGGSFSSIGNPSSTFRNGLAKLDTSGNVDPLWNPNANFTVATLAVTGSIVYAGGTFNALGGLSSVTRTYIAALSATGDGAPTSWDPELNNEALTLAVSSTGTSVYAGGIFTMVNVVARNNLAAFDDSTGQATSWNPIANSTVNALALSTSGPTTIYAGGLFTAIGVNDEFPRQNVAAIDTTGVPTAWAPTFPGSSVDAIAILGSTVYLGGDQGAVEALDGTTGTPLGSFTAVINDGVVSSLVASGSRVYAGGSFTTVNGSPHPAVVALDSTSGSVIWDGAGSGNVASLALSGTTLYVGGPFTSMGGQSRNDIAALNTATGLATSWNPSANGPVEAMAVDGQSVFAGGQFGIIGGQSRNELAELDATTGDATAWNPNPNNGVLAIEPLPSQLILGGSFTTFDDGPAAGFAIFARTTSPPSITSFSPASGPIGTQVTITGSTFTGATAVSFHGTPAQSFSVDSDTQITAFVKPGTTSGPITVTNAVGTATSSASFTVIQPPTISGISPAHGPYGTTVTVTGANLAGATSVKLNGSSISFTPVSASSFTFVVPVGATSGPVSISTPGGNATSAATFLVEVLPPVVSSFTPSSGTELSLVKINGLHFSGVTAVTFNGTSAAFTVVSDTQITAHVPTGATTGHIAVTSPGGTIASVAIYTVVPAVPPVPTIASFTPATGIHGITSVVVKGTGFTGATSVKFNGSSAAFTVLSDSVIKAVVPLGATSGTISVTTPGGSITSAASFTVT